MARVYNYDRVVSYQAEVPSGTSSDKVERTVRMVSKHVIDCMLDGTTLLIDLPASVKAVTHLRVLRGIKAKLESIGVKLQGELKKFDRVTTYLVVTNTLGILPDIGKVTEAVERVRGVAACLVVEGDDEEHYRVLVDIDAAERSATQRRTIEQVLDALQGYKLVGSGKHLLGSVKF